MIILICHVCLFSFCVPLTKWLRRLSVCAWRSAFSGSFVFALFWLISVYRTTFLVAFIFDGVFSWLRFMTNIIMLCAYVLCQQMLCCEPRPISLFGRRKCFLRLATWWFENCRKKGENLAVGRLFFVFMPKTCAWRYATHIFYLWITLLYL